MYRDYEIQSFIKDLLRQDDHKRINMFYAGFLNPSIWRENKKLKPKIRKALLQISDDFVKFCKFNFLPQDIIFCGSLSNYNWHQSSDIDLHLIIDFDKISKDSKLVQNYVDSLRRRWNIVYEDIMIEGYTVELYIQDKQNPKNHMTSYSILKDEWIRQPQNVDNVEIDVNMIIDKSKDIMEKIKTFEQKSKQGYNILQKVQTFKDKLVDKRRKSVSNQGQFGQDNLIYKYLRQKGWLDRLHGLIKKERIKRIQKIMK